MPQPIEIIYSQSYSSSNLKQGAYFVFEKQLHYKLSDVSPATWYNFETCEIDYLNLNPISEVLNIEFEINLLYQKTLPCVRLTLFNELPCKHYFIMPGDGRVCQKMNNSEYFDIGNHDLHQIHNVDVNIIPCDLDIKVFLK